MHHYNKQYTCFAEHLSTNIPMSLPDRGNFRVTPISPGEQIIKRACTHLKLAGNKMTYNEQFQCAK